jgi:hypothetical protein
MIVGFNKLQSALIFHQKLCDVFGGLIVHDVQSGLEAFDSEFVKIKLYASNIVLLSRPVIGVARIAFDS